MYYIIGSKEVVEREEDLKTYTILAVANNLLEVHTFFEEYIPENRDDEFWNWRHIAICDANSVVHAYYFQHKWLPDNAWFRLYPVYDKIKPYVKPPKEGLDYVHHLFKAP